MKVIIAEKPIAGKRIATILSGNNIVEDKLSGAPYYMFSTKEDEYVMIPLRGHIENVDFPSHYSSWLGTSLKRLIDADIIHKPTATNIIKVLKKFGKKANEIIIATDADREGEAIGVEGLKYIQEVNNKITIKRAYFSAITPKEINNAFSNLTDVDFNLAEAANSRKEIDLIWGAVLTRFFSLSTGNLGRDFLSVGRVQSPTLSLIVHREKERQAFKPVPYWEINGIGSKDKTQFEVEHKTGKFWEENVAKEQYAKLKEGVNGEVTKVTRTKKTLKRPVPFNTTDFLRAATAIGFAPDQAINVAEELYMQGYTSYPRTDNSVYPASIDLRNILIELNKVPELKDHADNILVKKKLDPSKGKETKDHPPIYPVTAAEKGKLSERQWKIYELIARRFLATLSEDAQTDNVRIDMDFTEVPFVARGQILRVKGWKEVYPYSKSKEVILPDMKEKDTVTLEKFDYLSKETQPPSRFTQGKIIQEMAKQNLGTKATRPEILKKLYARGYITGRKSIEPSASAMMLVDSLDKYAENISKPIMTSRLEEAMDLIANGKKKKDKVVEESRELLHSIIDKLEEDKKAVSGEMREAMQEANKIGQCPKCKKGDLRIIKSKASGKRFIGCNNYPSCKNSFPLPQNGKVTILEDLCDHCENYMIKIDNGSYNYQMCIDPKCKSKESWGKKDDKAKKTFKKTYKAVKKTVKKAATKTMKKTVKKTTKAVKK